MKFPSISQKVFAQFMGGLTAWFFPPASLHDYQTRSRVVIGDSVKHIENVMTKINLALPENGDEVAVSIAPTSERVEECLKVLSAVESRMVNLVAMTESDRQAAIAAIGNLRRFFSESRAKAHYQIQKIKMPLDQKDLEQIERIIYKNSDDICVANARSFERLEERMDAMESRIYSRMADVEVATEGSRQDILEAIADLTQLFSESQRAK